MKRFLLLFISILLVLPVFSFDVSAGDDTVVFLRDGGTGDGSSVSKAVGTLADAYNALDLSKDCTIVICRDFNQSTHFTYGKYYTGSVRITSVHDGVDYKKKYGAEYISTACRFVAYGETIFDDIDLKLTGNYFFIIANCYPITLTENFNPVYTKKVSGNAIDSGVSILGGYQNAQDMPEFASYKDINITVNGGKNICIAAYNRALPHGYHFGTANITVGGKAQVGTIRFASLDVDDVICGNVNITVKDSAQVGYIRTGNGNNLDVSSLVVTWQGGKISNFIPAEEKEIDGVKVKTTEFDQGTWLRYSDAAVKTKEFDSIAGLFENSLRIGSDDDNFVPVKAEKPEKPVTSDSADISSAPDIGDVTASPDTDELEFPEPVDDTGIDDSTIIIIASAVIAICAIVIILLLRKK